jgi:hypothetical protein
VSDDRPRLPIQLRLARALAEHELRELRAARAEETALSLCTELSIDRRTFEFELERMAEGLGEDPEA